MKPIFRIAIACFVLAIVAALAGFDPRTAAETAFWMRVLFATFTTLAVASFLFGLIESDSK